MQVQVEVRSPDDGLREGVSDDGGGPLIGTAGKDARQVAAVQRARPGAIPKRRGVRHRHGQQIAAHGGRVELIEDLEDRAYTLELIPMDSRRDDECLTRPRPASE